MELSVGKNLSSGASLAGVKKNLEIIPVDERVAEKAGEVMADLKNRGEREDINEIYIAATGLGPDALVLTANINHFRRVEGIEVVDWRNV
ncbi:MAG: type II toxin-antitoxin system VapC family toxin [Candidatus Nanohaloarchaea archaeon]